MCSRNSKDADVAVGVTGGCRGGRWIVEVFLRMLALNEESGILPSRGVT